MLFKKKKNYLSKMRKRTSTVLIPILTKKRFYSFRNKNFYGFSKSTFSVLKHSCSHILNRNCLLNVRIYLKQRTDSNQTAACMHHNSAVCVERIILIVEKRNENRKDNILATLRYTQKTRNYINHLPFFRLTSTPSKLLYTSLFTKLRVEGLRHSCSLCNKRMKNKRA